MKYLRFFTLAALVIITLFFLLKRTVKRQSGVSIDELRNNKAQKIKNQTIGKLTNKAYVMGGGGIFYYKKQDFFIPVFNDIKNICEDIIAIDISFDTQFFKITIDTSEGKQITYQKSNTAIHKQAIQQPIGSINLALKEKDTSNNCKELIQMINFIKWDYEHNEFTSLSYGIPEFISKQIKSFSIKQSLQNPSSWQ